MKILIVCATQMEYDALNVNELSSSTSHDFVALISGIGAALTSYSLTKHLQKNKYDLILNVGVCGSFNSKIEIGDVVEVTEDCFADVGAQDDAYFLSVVDLNLMDENLFPFRKNKLHADFVFSSHQKIKKVKGVTVNTTHGNEKSIEQFNSIYNGDIESMEGAAVFYCALMENTLCAQLRAVSNRVEKRNRAAWNIPLALQNLNIAFIKLMEELSYD